MEFSIAYDGEVRPNLSTKKMRELLAFLLLNSERPHRRQFLMTLLWEDSEESKAQKYLRQTLWQIQSELAPCYPDSETRPLLVNADWVQIDPEAGIWSDAVEFLRLHRRSQGIAGPLLEAEHIKELEEATALYKGDLLEGWYQNWCLIEREYLQNIYLIMLEKLMDNCESHANYEQGLEYGMRALKQDSARERTYRRLMRLYTLMGDRNSALHLYEQCVEALRDELDVAPAQSTQSLYELIRRDDLLQEPGPELRRARFPGKTTGRVVDHLQLVHDNLGEIQALIREEIESFGRLYP